MAVQRKYIIACGLIICVAFVCHYQSLWGWRYSAQIQEKKKPAEPVGTKRVAHRNFNRWKRLLANRTYTYTTVLRSASKSDKKLSVLPSHIDIHVGNSSTKSSHINRTCFFFKNGNVYDPEPWDKEVLRVQHCSRRLPGAVIFGTRQCGTSKLDFYLRTHPDIAFTKSEEMHFFGSPKEVKGIDWYHDQMMMSKANQVTMEKTPKYYVRPKVPKQLYDVLGEKTQLLLVVRDPVERAKYDFLQLQEVWGYKGKELMDRWAHFNGTYDDYYFLLNGSFGTTVLKPSGEIRQENALVYLGCYSFFLERWLKYFSLSQILIINLDDLESDPVTVLKRVERFLHIDHYFGDDKIYFDLEKRLYCLASPFNHCADETQGRVLPEVGEAVVQKLRDFYRPHNQKLCRLVPETCSYSWM